MTENIEVLQTVKSEIDKIMNKYAIKCQKEQEKIKDAYVIFKGEKLFSEDAIMDAYGCDMMTSEKCDKLIEKLNKKKGIADSSSKTKNQEIYDELEEISNSLSLDISFKLHLEKEKKEREERIQADMAKGCSYSQAIDNEEFRQTCIQMENAGII